MKSIVEQSLRAKLREAYGTIEKLKEGTKQLQLKVCTMSDKLKAEAKFTTRGRDKTRAFDDISDRHMRRIKRRRVSSCNDSLAWLQLEGYTPRRVELLNNRTGAL